MRQGLSPPGALFVLLTYPSNGVTYDMHGGRQALLSSRQMYLSRSSLCKTALAQSAREKLAMYFLHPIQILFGQTDEA